LSTLRANRTTLVAVYYAGVSALILVGAILWATGHGTGDPYLSVGIALALVPIAVVWIRRRFSRD
jgi:hypothetical protein